MARKILRPAKKPNFLIRNRDRLQQKREAVAEAAFELLLKEGFHRTTTRDIAQRAGVSAGAPFTYFKDKENILFHIVSKEQDRAGEQLLSALSRQIAEATHTGADPEEVFKHVFATFLRGVDEMRRFILLAYQETKSLNTETRQALIAVGDPEHVTDILQQLTSFGVEQVLCLMNFGGMPFRYIRGAGGYTSVERIKLMKLLWDALASEFGGRRELYERNYSGNVDDARIQTLLAATATGTTEAMKALVDQCLSEYDLDGWKIPGMVNPNDVNVFTRRQGERN